jgi:redox-sensing transcriptional repressor
MLIGYTGTLRKGYNVKELIELIGEIIDSQDGINVAIIGMGNLGRALINYFTGKRSHLKIIASFDINPDKIGNSMSGVPCYAIDDLGKIVKEQNIKVAIMTVPADFASQTADLLAKVGIKGILNYTPKPVNVPKDVYLEEYDMITSLEKVAFYVKMQDSE